MAVKQYYRVSDSDNKTICGFLSTAISDAHILSWVAAKHQDIPGIMWQVASGNEPYFTRALNSYMLAPFANIKLRLLCKAQTAPQVISTKRLAVICKEFYAPTIEASEVVIHTANLNADAVWFINTVDGETL